MNEIKIDERPSYVSTGRIVDEKGKFVCGTQTKEQSEKIVAAVHLMNKLIKDYAKD